MPRGGRKRPEMKGGGDHGRARPPLGLTAGPRRLSSSFSMGNDGLGTDPREAARADRAWNLRDAAWAACFEAGLFALFFNTSTLLLWAGKLFGWLGLEAAGGLFGRMGAGYPVALWAFSRAFSGPIVAWRASREFGVPLREFGVRKPRGGVRWVVLFTAALALVYVGGGALLFYCRRDWALLLTPREAIGKMGFTWAAVAFCFSAPVGEEVIYRGILYPPLREKFGVAKAVLISAAIFAVMHNVLSLSLFLPVTQFAGGLIFAYAYEKSGSLVYPMIYHACGNGLLFIAFALG